MKYKTIDLFAGAGGLSLGFKMTGKFDIVAAAEINENAKRTYLNNIPEPGSSFEMINNVVGYDFASLSNRIGGIDVVIGGPPCQGFSNANRQKNHLISMNNALVKEFFRAIKEIEPKAFVMENVKMLSSDKHRFFESEIDNDFIISLRRDGAAIPLKNEILYIAPAEIVEIDEATEKGDFKGLKLPEKLNDYIRVLDKNLKNPKRLNRFIEKNKKDFAKQIDLYIEEAVDEVAQRLESIRTGLVDNDFEMLKDNTSYLANLQKALSSIQELKDNRIIGFYRRDLQGDLVFETNSYSVIDYVNAILGDSYVQTGGVLNAKWFGVPQDRKRHIIMGVRKDIAEGPIELPKEPETYKAITVGAAISDLTSYPVGYESYYEPVKYRREDNLSSFARQMRKGSLSVKNHIVTSTRDTALERFAAIEKGANFHSLDDRLKGTYSNPARTQNTIYLRLDPNLPSGTVVNVRKSMWIHPELNRAISVREAARLQSFPDYFEFVGTKDSQYQQVGNAVPPLLSYKIANTLYKYL